jgi:hypothetical protein
VISGPLSSFALLSTYTPEDKMAYTSLPPSLPVDIARLTLLGASESEADSRRLSNVVDTVPVALIAQDSDVSRTLTWGTTV